MIPPMILKCLCRQVMKKFSEKEVVAVCVDYTGIQITKK